MTTSCLDNTEPAGIEAMRQAKAELISAQAAYKAAETAYLTAQQALIDAELAKKELENQMLEIDLQAKQLALELQEAQNEHAIRMLELEYLRQQAEDEARQKELEAEIAYWEYLIAKNQMDTELLDLEREKALERHNAKMLELQAATARAEYELEMALRNLEALRAGLTETEQNQLNALVAVVGRRHADHHPVMPDDAQVAHQRPVGFAVHHGPHDYQRSGVQGQYRSNILLHNRYRLSPVTRRVLHT